MKESIKAEASRLGFKLVGVTTPDPPPHYDVYERWLEAGRHGEMGYLATEAARTRRVDPRQILPECRSILVLGMRYWSPEENGETGPAGEKTKKKPFDERAGKRKDQMFMGRVAAYAWGQDYHDVFKRRLKQLVEFIQSAAGEDIPNRWYSDTGAILERDLAQRAGLGWIGKNTCLIHPQKGSYILLAEILLGIELEPDPPFVHDRCGNCHRCIEACPTGCILSDRTIDSRRCISYLTIELKGEITRELRPFIGDWVFGCDVCQQVCPWNNRFAEMEGDPVFAPRPDVAVLNLAEELNLDPEGFSRKYKENPLKRAKRRGYLRNVAVALGNKSDPAAIPLLERSLLNEKQALVRLHVAWALGWIGGNQVKKILEVAQQNERDDSVLKELHYALKDV